MQIVFKLPSYIFTIAIALVLCLLAYYNFQSNVPTNKNPVSICINATYPHDDVCKVYYTTKENDHFHEIKSKILMIRGGESPQDICFLLPPFLKLRFDYSKNKEQNRVEVNSMQIAQFNQKFDILPEQYADYLKLNKYLKIDSLNVFHSKVIENSYHPIFTLDKIPLSFTKPTAIDSYFSVFTLLILGVFVLLTFSIHPFIKVFVERQSLEIIKRYQWFFMVLMFLIIKGLSKIYFSDIWAEDGTVFIKGQMDFGLSALTRQYAGYYHTFPRLLVQLFSIFPAIFMPFLISISCYFIYALLLVEIVKKEYNWIIPDARAKLLLILCWCSTPGLDEVLGNLANLHWILLTFLAILSLKDLKSEYTFVDLAIAFFCISSEGASFILVPVFLSRIVLKFPKTKSLKSVASEISILGFMSLFVILNFAVKDGQSSMSFGINQWSVFFQNFTSHFIIEPFLGDNLTLLTVKSQRFFISVGSVVLLVLGFLFIKRKSKRFILIFFASVCMLPVLISMARVNNVDVLLNYFNSWVGWWQYRYSFFLPFFGYMFWVWVLSNQKSNRTIKIAFIWLLFVSLVINTSRIFNRPIGINREWIASSSKIDLAKKGILKQEFLLPIYPNGWKIKIKNKSR